MPNQPNFPIPSVINPEKTRCIQLQIPDNDDWIRVFVGLLAQPSYWFNWQRTGDTQGSQCATVWTELFDAIDWSDMSCCCGEQQPVIYRYGAGGVYQRSTDGGATWQDAPTYAYQNTSTQWPNPNDLGIATSKCQAADGVVQTFKQQIITDLNDSMTAAEILGAIAAVILFFASAGSTALIEAQITAISAAIAAAGVSAVQAAFTDAVWNKFRCLIYMVMDTDSSINQGGVDALFSMIDTEFTGIVVPILKSLIPASGAVPLTNMMRSGAGSVDADCDSCSATCDLANWHVGPQGTEISRTDTTITIESVYVTGSGSYAQVTTDDPSLCCNVEPSLGTGFNISYIPCGMAIVPENFVTYTGGFVCACFIMVSRTESATFDVTYTFEQCP